MPSRSCDRVVMPRAVVVWTMAVVGSVVPVSSVPLADPLTMAWAPSVVLAP